MEDDLLRQLTPSGCRNLAENGKHNILGGTAARLFKLPPRNAKEKTEPDQARQSCGVTQAPLWSSWHKRTARNNR
jgi:hypothetical protein